MKSKYGGLAHDNGFDLVYNCTAYGGSYKAQPRRTPAEKSVINMI
jgi:hypothetical protein